MSNSLLLNSSRKGRDANFYVIYGTVLLILWTIALACNALFGQYAWIDHRDVDGPAAYIEENISAAYNTLGTTAGVIMNFLSDGLLVSSQVLPINIQSPTRADISLLHSLEFVESYNISHFPLFWRSMCAASVFLPESALADAQY